MIGMSANVPAWMNRRHITGHWNTCSVIFFFNGTAPTEIYTLSLHDALPISGSGDAGLRCHEPDARHTAGTPVELGQGRSEEHTSELQSHDNLVCRLLLE